MGTIRTFLIVISVLISLPINIFGANDTLNRKQVIYLGRIVPFHTVVKDLSFKLSGESSEILISDNLDKIPIIKVNNQTLADSLGIKKGERIPITTILNEIGESKLSHLYLNGDKEYDRELKKLDEKATLFYLYKTEQLWEPIDSTFLSPIPQWEVSLEIFFNRVNITGWLYIVAFSCLGLGIVCCWIKKSKLIWITGIFPSLVSILDFVLMWIIKNEIPLTNGEEVMVFLSMILFVISSIISIKQCRIGIGILSIGCFTSLVAHITGGSHIVIGTPQGLISPWLAIHVSVIMSSYAFLLVLLPYSIAMEIRNDAEELVPTAKVINIVGVILLGLGIILGSLWAKSAWGEYWSWDPKETWALLTFTVYLLPLFFGKCIFKSPRIYGLLLILAFCFIAMTYFGVNYFIGGLHSYV